MARARKSSLRIALSPKSARPWNAGNGQRLSPLGWSAGKIVLLLSVAGLYCPLVTGNNAQASSGMLTNRRQ
jgi:hypothetical protein